MTDEERKVLVQRLRRTYLKSPNNWSLPTQVPLNRDGPEVADQIEADGKRIAELEAALRAANEAHWFYFGNDYESDQCRFCIDECISEDFEWDNIPKGNHVLQISGARPVPDMWVALHYFTEAEKDDRDDDEPYAYTVHATEEEASAALGETK